jgi:hypothetical protein
MLMGSPDQKARGQSFVSFLDSEAEDLLTFSQWKAKRQELRDTNKIFDPTNRVIKKNSVTADYEPPSIDSAPASWHDKIERKKKTRRTDTYEFQVS